MLEMLLFEGEPELVLARILAFGVLAVSTAALIVGLLTLT